MLIVCPSCATSYMIETASLGEGGRMVRCARCKATWFAGGAQEEEQQQVSAFVDEVIAEAEAESVEPEPFLRAPAGEMSQPPSLADNDFVGSHTEESPAAPEPAPVPDAAFDTEYAPAAAYDTAADAPHENVFDEEASHAPETVTESPSLVPPLEQEAPDDHDAQHEAEDVESFAARRRRLKSRRKQAKRSSRWTAVILVLFAFNVALIGGRSEVVRYLPQTASLFAAIGLPVNLRELKFENVHIAPSGMGGEGLTVQGTIVSVAGKAVKVPLLRFAVRNAAGQEIYTWTTAPKRRMLDPGATLDFRSELASPPANAKDVLVRFATAQEAADMAPDKPGGMAKPDQTGGNHSADQ